jgi:transposase
LGGERDPAALAEHRDPRVKATPEIIQKSLVGNWLPEDVFVLRQSRALYLSYQQQIVDCDREIGRLVSGFEPRADHAEKPLPPDRKRNRNAQKKQKKQGLAETGFDLRTEAYKLFGVDVTQIPGLEGAVASRPVIVSMRWPSIGNQLMSR